VEGESLRVAPIPVLTNALRDLAVEAARRGGTVLKSYYGAQGRIAMKADGAGPVTDADLASQTTIVETLPPSGLAVLAEEDDVVPRDALRRWIVDPLEGTSNFIRHLPWFCVGIALATANDIELSVVYAPLTRRVVCCRAAASPASGPCWVQSDRR